MPRAPFHLRGGGGAAARAAVRRCARRRRVGAHPQTRTRKSSNCCADDHRRDVRRLQRAVKEDATPAAARRPSSGGRRRSTRTAWRRCRTRLPGMRCIACGHRARERGEDAAHAEREGGGRPARLEDERQRHHPGPMMLLIASTSERACRCLRPPTGRAEDRARERGAVAVVEHGRCSRVSGPGSARRPCARRRRRRGCPPRARGLGLYRTCRDDGASPARRAAARRPLNQPSEKTARHHVRTARETARTAAALDPTTTTGAHLAKPARSARTRKTGC